MSCPECGGPTGSGAPDDPHFPYHNDPAPEVLFCSRDCLEAYDIDKTPATFGVAVSPP